MARTNVTEAQDGQTGAEGAEGATAETKAKATASVMVQMPIELKNLVEAKAKESDLNVAAYVRKLLADTVEYTLPLPTARGRKSKYAGLPASEVKKLKQEESRKRQLQIKALLAMVKDQGINLDELLAKYEDKIEIKPRKRADAEDEAVEAEAATASA